jgi:hypothetical protein
MLGNHCANICWKYEYTLLMSMSEIHVVSMPIVHVWASVVLFIGLMWSFGEA